ncbi:MAG TPA: hypothetical protein VL362_02890 [Patescibacteria group bacterium]|jgi:hypothetical protein|nr:hypothetical protein [Patescibacteria group bacterium]
MPNLTTFHGADGCGKSTIAAELALLEGEHGETVSLGGSSYKEWLTPQIAKETLGDDEIFRTEARTPAQKTRLYEAIAAACYGYAHYLNESGVSVVIDSDPVIKRIVWTDLELEDVEEKDRYARRFGSYLLDHLPASFMMGTVVGVNFDSAVSDHDIHDRLTQRGGNSEYDPQGVAEVRKIRESSAWVWAELQRASTQTSTVDVFNALYATSDFVAIENPNCSDELIRVQARMQAERIAG